MDQERNMFDSQGREAMQEGVVDGAAAAEAIEDEEAQAIVAEAELEKSQIESELAEVERRLDLEYTMLGKRAFQFAQTDAELASRLGVALAAVTAQTERKVRLSRSLEAMEKKTADRLTDLKRAREAQESARMSEEDLVRKEEAAREAMERAWLLEQEAEQARHVRESALHEADAAALAASRTMLISFTDDAPMAPEASEAPVESMAFEEPEAPAMPELSEVSEASITTQDAEPALDESGIWDAIDSEALGTVNDAQQCNTEEGVADPQEAPAVEEDFVSDLSPALQAMFGPVSFPESESEIQGEPASPEGSEQQEGEELAEESTSTLDAEAEIEPEIETEVTSESTSEEVFESAVDSDAEPEAEPEAGASWGFTPAPAMAPQPEPKRDPNATLLLSDYDDQSAAQPINPEATLLLDDDADIADEKGATCPSCGFEVQEGDKFCLRCGTKLESPEPEQSAVLDAQPETASEAVLEEASHDEVHASDEVSDVVPSEGASEHIPAHASDAANVSEPPVAPVPSMRCCVCGAEIQLGDRFCMRCGARQEQPAAALIAPAPVASAPICMNCGLELNPGDKFCMRCGTPVQQVPTPQAPQVPVARLCPHCGAEYSETDKFCMMCGTPL